MTRRPPAASRSQSSGRQPSREEPEPAIRSSGRSPGSPMQSSTPFARTFLTTGLRRAREEVRRGGDAAVEAGPGLALGEGALDAVEAAERAAEVVHRVDEGRLAGGGDDGRALFELSVVGQDDVQDR